MVICKGTTSERMVDYAMGCASRGWASLLHIRAELDRKEAST